MGPGDLVVYLPDPLLFSGELLIIGRDPGGRLICEAVHYDVEHEDDPPPRAILEPHEVELASVWARA
jgi:hypothetical protein